MIAQNKIISGLSNEVYHADMSLSSSNLKNMLISPYHYWYRKHAPQEQTPALIFGSLLHTMLLEPALLDEEYFIMDKPKRNSMIGKLAYAELDEERGQRHWITPEEYSQASTMIASLMSNKMVQKMLGRSEVEQSLFFKDKETGADCKVRADAISLKNGVVLDLKSTAISANEDDFKYTIRRYKYDLSAAFYSDAFENYCGEPLDFIWLVVEKNFPCSYGIYKMSPEMRLQGREKYREALTAFERAKTTRGFQMAHNEARIIELVA